MLGLPQVVALGGLNMRRMMGVIKNRHGTYYAQVKVPVRLQEAAARMLGLSQPRKKWLKKSLGTKDQKQAHIRAKPVLMGFDRVLAEASDLLKQRPLRTSLALAEIDRVAEYHFAKTLADDEEERREGPVTTKVSRALPDSLQKRALTSRCQSLSPAAPLTAYPTGKWPSEKPI
jgi:hypothetical protein